MGARSPPGISKTVPEMRPAVWPGSGWLKPLITLPLSTAASSNTTITNAIRDLKNLTPADVYFGREQTIKTRRESLSKDSLVRVRIMLAFYLTIAEGSGFYEMPN
jgi:hypothetical protein